MSLSDLRESVLCDVDEAVKFYEAKIELHEMSKEGTGDKEKKYYKIFLSRAAEIGEDEVESFDSLSDEQKSALKKIMAIDPDPRKVIEKYDDWFEKGEDGESYAKKAANLARLGNTLAGDEIFFAPDPSDSE